MQSENNKFVMQQITRYLLYTFCISWSSWLIIIVANKYYHTLLYGEPFFWIPYTIGSLGPAISAYIFFQKFRKEYPDKTFLKYIFKHKIVNQTWLLFFSFIAWRLWMIWFSFGIVKPISILAIFVNLPFLILWGGLEELGWRGILQPKLEVLISFIPSVIVASFIWSAWHIPLWFITGTVQSMLPFGLYLVSGLVLTASFTALYKYTNNLFLCILNHAWFNGCIGLALIVGNDGLVHLNLNWKVVAVFSLELILSLLLLALYKRRKI